jgi:hypothetical protein
MWKKELSMSMMDIYQEFQKPVQDDPEGCLQVI